MMEAALNQLYPPPTATTIAAYVLDYISCSTDVLLSVLLLLAAPVFCRIVWGTIVEPMWLRPRRIRKMFESQGITCLPADSAFGGNLSELVELGKQARKSPMPHIAHNIAPRIMPHYYAWSERYGKAFVHWNGSQARFFLTHPQQAKEVLSTKFGDYPKLKPRPETKDLIGDGLVDLEGEKWAQHRHILGPAFFHKKLKIMVPTMAACTVSMMERWEQLVAHGHDDIDVHTEFKNLTADIIAHTGFGSSYAEGKRVFELQHEQQVMLHNAFLKAYIPGMRFFPTATNRKRWRLNREINRILTKLIESRLQSMAKSGDHGDDSHSTDLLGLMMAANRGDEQLADHHNGQKNKKVARMGIPDIIGECKTFFFAGHETTSTVLTWACLLLASNPQWQERAREEVVALCGKNADMVPTAEEVNQMKIVGMVLSETMRLYPPVVMMARRTRSDIRLGGRPAGGGEAIIKKDEENEGVVIPAGTELLLPVVVWHHEPEYWGDDADEFRPERFDEGGAGKACRALGAYLPFSTGPRVCIGQNFAMMEAKTVLAAILGRFRFHVSPAYRHAPATVVTLQPEFGARLTFSPL